MGDHYRPNSPTNRSRYSSNTRRDPNISPRDISPPRGPRAYSKRQSPPPTELFPLRKPKSNSSLRDRGSAAGTGNTKSVHFREPAADSTHKARDQAPNGQLNANSPPSGGDDVAAVPPVAPTAVSQTRRRGSSGARDPGKRYHDDDLMEDVGDARAAQDTDPKKRRRMSNASKRALCLTCDGKGCDICIPKDDADRVDQLSEEVEKLRCSVSLAGEWNEEKLQHWTQLRLRVTELSKYSLSDKSKTKLKSTGNLLYGLRGATMASAEGPGTIVAPSEISANIFQRESAPPPPKSSTLQSTDKGKTLNKPPAPKRPSAGAASISQAPVTSYSNAGPSSGATGPEEDTVMRDALPDHGNIQVALNPSAAPSAGSTQAPPAPRTEVRKRSSSKPGAADNAMTSQGSASHVRAADATALGSSSKTPAPTGEGVHPLEKPISSVRDILDALHFQTTNYKKIERTWQGDDLRRLASARRARCEARANDPVLRNHYSQEKKLMEMFPNEEERNEWLKLNLDACRNHKDWLGGGD